MARTGGGITWTDESLFKNIETAPEKLDAVMVPFTEYWSYRIEGAAKANAPWQDQTGNARQGLTARPEHEPGKHSIVLFHRMPYGIWLETRWSGRYATIMPTLKEQGRFLMMNLKDLLRKM